MENKTPEYVYLDVSGRIFRVSRKLLEGDSGEFITSEFKGSAFLKGLLEDNSSLGTKENPIQIDRSPMLFEHVYAYMVDPLYLYPIECENEIHFYGLPLTTLKRPDLRGPPGEQGPPGRMGEMGPPGR
jgi:hypothetical protein